MNTQKENCNEGKLIVIAFSSTEKYFHKTLIWGIKTTINRCRVSVTGRPAWLPGFEWFRRIWSDRVTVFHPTYIDSHQERWCSQVALTNCSINDYQNLSKTKSYLCQVRRNIDVDFTSWVLYIWKEKAKKAQTIVKIWNRNGYVHSSEFKIFQSSSLSYVYEWIYVYFNNYFYLFHSNIWRRKNNWVSSFYILKVYAFSHYIRIQLLDDVVVVKSTVWLLLRVELNTVGWCLLIIIAYVAVAIIAIACNEVWTFSLMVS